VTDADITGNKKNMSCNMHRRKSTGKLE